MIKNNIQDKSPSNFNPEGQSVDITTYKDVTDICEKYMYNTTIDYNKCYKTGMTYSNNTVKKTAMDIVSELISNIKQHCDKKNQDTSMDLAFENIKNNITIVNQQSNEIDKQCVLFSILGYTIGCLKLYDEQSK